MNILNNPLTMTTDVVIIGAGNAAMCAALSARESGADVVVLEKSPESLKGGNTTYTHGSIRFAYKDAKDIQAIIPELDDEELKNIDFGTYAEEEFFDDMCRVTNYRTDVELASILTSESFPTMKWLTTHQIKFIPIYGRQAYKIDGRFQFWGGMVLESVGGGQGLVNKLHERALSLGIQILYESPAISLLTDDHGITGVVYKQNGIRKEVHAKAVIMASGGFHANIAMRTKYLGSNWDLAHTRGSRFNTGEGLEMALNIGALSAGNWSSAHAVGGDRYLPDFEEGFQRLSYPLGIVVNEKGKRFLDEGADFRNYTYAKYGKLILEQPNQAAWQIFDQKVKPLLREEYKGKKVTKVVADTLEELVKKMEGVDQEAFLQEMKEYNASIRKDILFNPNIKDGRKTNGLPIPKSNWANTIDEGPFEAYAVTCGITFTFGGLKINTKAEVQHNLYQSIPGLYAAGETVGGLFYSNYPGGTGLMAGSVFGRIAGENAAIFTREKMSEVQV